MASTNHAAALQGHRKRPTVSRPIVPAIPLPYMQKRSHHASKPSVDRDVSAPASSATRPPGPPDDDTPAAPSLDSNYRRDGSSVIAAGEETAHGTTSADEPNLGTEAQDVTSPTSSDHPSVVLPPRDLALRRPSVNHPASVSSLMFGEYHDSNNSSPAPPLGSSARNLPPGAARHGPAMQNGHAPMPHAYPAFHPPPDGPLSPGSGADGFARRPIISFAPPDSYSPSVTPGIDGGRPLSYDPTTPHSFQGSQSSAPNDQDMGQPFYHQHVRQNGSLEHNGHLEDVRLYHQPRPGKNRMSGPHYPQHSMVQPPMDNLDGLVGYLQSQFGDPSFADYTLELRYSDDRAEPVRIPGHNLLFARSPALKVLMAAQARDPNTDGFTARTLLIESGDRFLRSDGFWLAAQRLYGGPLLDHGAPALNATALSKMSSPMPGTPADRFDLALGYAAAGHILQIPPVVNRGIEIASQFINWLTLEKALDFALDGGLDAQWAVDGHRDHSSSPTYAPLVNMLIHSVLNFIINAFPSNFELDTTVTAPGHFRRLPVVSDSRSGLHDPRLSFIRFGDTGDDVSPNGTTTTITATLSRILIELPFPLLKFILESQRLGSVQGWAAAPLRHKVMTAAIEEREKRRIKVRSSRAVSNAERAAHQRQWEPVGFEESVVMSGDVPSLQRRWVDVVLSHK